MCKKAQLSARGSKHRWVDDLRPSPLPPTSEQKSVPESLSPPASKDTRPHQPYVVTLCQACFDGPRKIPTHAAVRHAHTPAQSSAYLWLARGHDPRHGRDWQIHTTRGPPGPANRAALPPHRGLGPPRRAGVASRTRSRVASSAVCHLIRAFRWTIWSAELVNSWRSKNVRLVVVCITVLVSFVLEEFFLLVSCTRDIFRDS